MNQLSAIASMAAPASAVCAHCGAALSPGQAQYCCAGCAAAHALIGRMGLGAYYLKRLAAGVIRTDKPETEAELDVAALVERDGKGRCRLEVGIGGIQCSACVWLIEQVLAQEPDLLAGRVNMTTRRLILSWPDDGGASATARGNRLVSLVQRLGYRVLPLAADSQAAERKQEQAALLRAMAVAGFAAANVMLLSVSVWSGEASMGEATRALMHWLSALIALPAIAYAGRPFFASAVAAVRHGRTNMDVPISIGVILAAAMSLHETIAGGHHAYFDSAVMLLFFLLVGRYLDRRARFGAFAAAQNLAALQASTVRIVGEDGAHRQLPAQAVRAGMVALVAAGERLSVDGTIIEGRSQIDTSLLTGESAPRPARAGDIVHGGTLNIDAPLKVRVDAVGQSTVLAEIVRLMDAAERARHRYAGLADRVARYYAPVVHVAALSTFAVWLALGLPWQGALLIAVSVLIITCPCALALAVPAANVTAHGNLLRQGLLIKGTHALERLAAIDTIVFDKTGTLTLGRPEPLNWHDLDQATQRIVAGLASASRHPLARALARQCVDPPAASGVRELPGQGLEGLVEGKAVRIGRREFVGAPEGTGAGTEVWVQVADGAPVRIEFADRLREDAAEIVGRLRGLGIEIWLLSGDRLAPAREIASLAGIANWRAEMSPSAKLAFIAALRKEGHRVLMVGDGLNDGPALAGADVSASPGSAIDLARNSADIVFQGERLQPVVAMVTMARRTAAIVRQNLAIALVYNLAAVPAAMLGLVTPLIAALSMSGSSLVVIANALRLARPGR